MVVRKQLRKVYFYATITAGVIFLSTCLLLTFRLEQSFSSNDLWIMESPLQPRTTKEVTGRHKQKYQYRVVNSSLPYFVLHVGPQKTMSSAMQCSLYKLQPYLTRDGYQFLGKIDARACWKNSPSIAVDKAIEAPFYEEACVNEIIHSAGALGSVQCWKDFLGALKEQVNTTHVVLSDEKLSEVQLLWWGVDKTVKLWKLLQDELQDKFQFQIVMVYRRYYEWLASVKNQGDKYSLGRRGMKRWDGPAKEPIYPHLMRWRNNNTEIPSPYTPHMYNFYHDLLKLPVSLLNMHEGTDLLDNFICKVLRGATHTCQAYRINPSDYQYHSNPSENHFYDMIAYDAYHQGLIRDLRGYRKGADRLFVNEMISRRQLRLHGTAWDLPLACPTHEQVQPFLTESLAFEQDFLPDFFRTQLGGADLANKFWKDVDNQFYCSVNTTAVLEKSDWRLFLYNLWDPRRGKKPADWEKSNYTITNSNFTNLQKRTQKG